MRITPQDIRKGLWHLRSGGPRQLKEWIRRSNYELRSVGRPSRQLTDIEKLLGLKLPPVESHVDSSAQGKLKVAVILDDFSARAFEPEWDCVFIKPSDWESKLSVSNFDLLFVESAWAGNERAWQYHLTGPTAPRPVFVSMVKSFRENGVPTVFWNKEDPPHFDDFLDTAKLFEFVLTSDERKIPDYRRELEHDRIASLSFAAQPVFHNPVRNVTQERRDVAFAGMYFAEKYPERREQMEIVLGGALDVEHKLTYGLDIFSRQYGGEAKYQFPAPYDSHVVGNLDYDRMISAYKYYKVFLNVNSVVDSPSMCARRIFEITASGAAVVSTPSAAISKFFEPAEVIAVTSREQAGHAIRSIVRSPELRDRMVHLGQRNIWKNHTYAHRAAQIAEFAGSRIPVANAQSMTNRPKITAVVSTIRPGQLDHILATVGRQVDVDVELVLVAHGFRIDRALFEERANRNGVNNYQIFELSRSLSLGDCLNVAVQAAQGEFVTKMDDDDLYGSSYLFDQVAALRYSGASVVGKQAHYMYLGDSNVTLLRFAEREHRFTDLVMGPTMLGRADIFKKTPFGSRSRGEDTQFLRDVIDGGGTVYSSDRFNFTQMRGNDGQAHTWDLSDAELTSTGCVKWFGRNDEHIFF